MKSFFSVELPERDVRIGVAFAAAFNLIGFVFQIIITQKRPEVPLWPQYLSMLAGATILLWILTGKLQGKVSLVRSLFVVNATFVTFALTHLYSYYDGSIEAGIPFQASKLGTLVAGMLAPGCIPGLVAIALHTFVPVTQFYFFSPDVQKTILTHEPWALLAFGLGGIFVLVHRMQVRQLTADVEVAKAFLDLRDRMNTPIQSIEIACRLLKNDELDRGEIIHHLEESCARLHEVNQRLKAHDHHLEWSSKRGGLD